MMDLLYKRHVIPGLTRDRFNRNDASYRYQTMADQVRHDSTFSLLIPLLS